MPQALPFRCGDCGQPVLAGTTGDLPARGWRLLRVRDGLGNPVLWWRCGRCVSGGAHAFGETRVELAVPQSASTGASAH
ncbi:MAG TPA: hypothetical protein VGL81_18360 [Polyangiaceae bacterium]